MYLTYYMGTFVKRARSYDPMCLQVMSYNDDYACVGNYSKGANNAWIRSRSGASQRAIEGRVNQPLIA
ncbi:MAG: hypothetical protein NVS4B1_24250 [Ktedonobacteraceae bacterium]